MLITLHLADAFIQSNSQCPSSLLAMPSGAIWGSVYCRSSFEMLTADLGIHPLTLLLVETIYPLIHCGMSCLFPSFAVGVVAKVTSHHPSCQKRQEKQQGSTRCGVVHKFVLLLAFFSSYTKLLSAPGFCEDSVCYVIAAILAQRWPLSGREHNLC